MRRDNKYKSPNDLSDLSIDEIKRAVIESQTSFQVMIFGGKITEGYIAVPFAFRDQREKTLLIESLRTLVRHAGATQTWLISEAWMVKTQQRPGVTSAEIEAERAKLPPYLGDAEGRVEILVCQHETPAETKIWFFDIVRDAQGRIADLIRADKGGSSNLTTFNIWLLQKPEKLTAGDPIVHS